MMKQTEFFAWRAQANDRMFAANDFFKQFNMLDTATYEGGLISLKYKRTDRAIAARCDQYIRHHLQKCIEAGAGSGEMSDAVQLLFAERDRTQEHYLLDLVRWLYGYESSRIINQLNPVVQNCGMNTLKDGTLRNVATTIKLDQN